MVCRSVCSALKDMLGSNPLYETFLINLWPHKDRVVPLRMTTLQGLRMLHAAGVKPDIIYIGEWGRSAAVLA